MEILKRCREGQIKALYVVGENPLATLPSSWNVQAALSNLELLICQDPFLTETGSLAHIVFPACTFAEKDGTITNQEGKVQFVRPAFDPLGESALDWHITVGISHALGQAMTYESTQDIQDEIRKLLPECPWWIRRKPIWPTWLRTPLSYTPEPRECSSRG